MDWEGIEPTCPEGRRIYSPVQLPVLHPIRNNSVLGAGNDPAWPCGRRILSPLCLPVSPTELNLLLQYISFRHIFQPIKIFNLPAQLTGATVTAGSLRILFRCSLSSSGVKCPSTSEVIGVS